MEITELKSRLDTLMVCRHLFPAGRVSGNEFELGSLGGDSGKSLKVHLSGDKAGIWSDFATGQGGDIIDLWRLSQGQSLQEALDDIRAYLGVQKVEFTKPKQHHYDIPPKPQATRVKTPYLMDRGVSEKAVAAYKIGQVGNDLIFPFFWKGEPVLYKAREAVDGGKTIPTAKNCRPVLFGWQAIPDDARAIVICEGEIDALSLWDYGFPALSVPFGGGAGNKQQWIEHEFHNLDRFEIIYLCLDNDEVGHAAADEIADRLGRHRCKFVTLPYKDANECAQNSVLPADITECFINARHSDPEELVSAGEFFDAVEAVFRPAEGERLGYTVPWTELDGKIVFRPHELTLWTGASGAGKSQVLSHALVGMMHEGAKVCLASLEMTPTQSLKRMVKQLGGVDVPTQEFLKDCINWLDGKLWLYNFVGRASIDTLLDGFEYARKRYGVDTFVIDSFMRLGIGVDDYRAQDDAIFRLTDWAVARPVHLHLVAHARKSSETAQVPETESVKGTSEIGANAFNIVGIYRNRGLEDDLAQAQLDGDTEKVATLSDLPGVKINIAKQRNGDFEGKRGLFFDARTYRYSSSGIDTKKYIPLEGP